jgi:CDP-diglyceride synthetase
LLFTILQILVIILLETFIGNWESAMRRRSNRFIPLAIAAIVILTVVTISYRYSRNKYKDMNFTAQRYVTTGIFNKHKMYKIDKMDVIFSDGSLAVVRISGLQDKAPHKNVVYKMFLEKNKSGIWNVEKVYTD